MKSTHAFELIRHKYSRTRSSLVVRMKKRIKIFTYLLTKCPQKSLYTKTSMKSTHAFELNHHKYSRTKKNSLVVSMTNVLIYLLTDLLN